MSRILDQNWTRSMLTVGLLGSLTLGTVSVAAQESSSGAGVNNLTNAPVDMHEGTCADPTLDPWEDVGRLQPQRYGAVAGDLNTTIDPAGFFTEDADDDGILDDGEDLNANGVLDVGVDADADGILDAEEIVDEGEALVAVVNLPTIYTAEGEVDANFEAIFGQENVIAVHQSSDEYETIIACGNLGGVAYEEGEQVVIGLSPVGNSGVRGYAVFDFDPSLFGNEFSVVDVYLFENLPTRRDAQAATPTP